MKPDTLNRIINRRNIVILVILSVLLLLIRYAATQSIIEIVMAEEPNHQNTVQITGASKDSSTRKVAIKAGESQTIKLTTGYYQLLSTNDKGSHYSALKTQGFFRKTTVTVSYEPEAERSFVADNPSECFFNTSQDEIISTPCESQHALYSIHRRASSISPTYATQSKPRADGLVDNHLSYGNEVFAIIKKDRNYSLNKAIVGRNIEYENLGKLEGLSQDFSYSFQRFDGGFTAYSAENGEVFYFDTPSSTKPRKKSTLPLPDKNNSYVGHSLTKSGEAVFYGNRSLLEGNLGVLTIRLADGSKKSLRTSFEDVELCGSNYICVLDRDGVMRVIDFDTMSVKLQISGIREIKNATTGVFYMISDFGIIAFNSEELSFKVLYSFGSYAYGGSSLDISKLVKVSLNKKAYLLKLDDKKPSTAIDKKAVALYNSPYARASINGEFVYIAPEMGEAGFNAETGLFSHPQSKIDEYVGRINALVDSQQIDRTKYKIIIPH